MFENVAGSPGTIEFSGIVPYLPTPLRDGTINRECVTRLVDDLISAGVEGLAPLGSTGEVMYLDSRQRFDMVDAVVKAAAGRVPVIAGVADFSTRGIRQQIGELEAAGVDGFVIILQRYFPLTKEQQYSFYSAAAAATELPVVIYSNSLLGDDISVDLAERLAGIPNVRYLKDASSNTGKLFSILERTGKELDVFAASAHVPAFVFELGGVGWMAGPACIAPKAAVAMWRAWLNGDRSRMWSLQDALWPLNEMFQKHSAARFIKFALSQQGYDVGDPCLPQEPINGVEAKEVSARLTSVCEKINNLLA